MEWKSPTFRNRTMPVVAITLRHFLFSFSYHINACSLIAEAFNARSGLSCGTSLGNSALLIYGQFGLHVVVTERYGFPFISKIAIIPCIWWLIYRCSPTWVDRRMHCLLARTMLTSCSCLWSFQSTLEI